MKKDILTLFIIAPLIFAGGATIVSAQTITMTSVGTSDIAALQEKITMLMKQIDEMKAAIAAQKKEIQVLREDLKLTKRLVRGDEGDEVSLLQKLLATDPKIYPEGKITGFYGALTERAVKRFQAKTGLEGVGIVGPKTREVLNKVFKEGGVDNSEKIPTGLLREHGTYAMAKLSPQNDSGLWGHAKIAATGLGKARVVVELVRRDNVMTKSAVDKCRDDNTTTESAVSGCGTGTPTISTPALPALPLDGPYPMHIHAGACPAPGAVKYPLSPFVNGRSETVLDATYEDVVKQMPLAVNLHKSADNLSAYVACGDLHVPSAIWKAGTHEGIEKPKVETANMKQMPVMMKAEPATMKTEPATSATGNEIRVIELSASDYKFSNSEIHVKKGERVKVVLKVENGLHDWTLDEFGARTKQMSIGEVGTAEFVADKAGTFEYYCSFGNHRTMGMVGKLIVQ